MSVAGWLIGGPVSAVFDAAGRWAGDGAVWLLGQVGHAITATTSVDLTASWFAGHERVMATLAAAVVLPMACCTVLLAVYRQDAGILLRAFLVHLPLALVLTGVAVQLVQLSLAITDQLSNRVLAAGGVDADHVFSALAGAFTLSAPVTGPAVPAFVLFLGGVLVAIAAMTLWLELVVRSAAVAAATLFLPLALAGLVWPAVSHWARRLADTIAALVLSKLVVAAVLSLAAGAIAGGGHEVATGDTAGGFAAAVTGMALLCIATMAPFTLLKLVPAVEAGAVLHLESARGRLTRTATAPLRAGGMAVEIARDAAARSALSGAGPAGMAGAASGMAANAAASGTATAAASGGAGTAEEPGAIRLLDGMSPEEATAHTGIDFSSWGPVAPTDVDDPRGATDGR